MEYRTSLDIFRKYFERQLEYARKTLNKPEFLNQPFITLSRLTGAGDINFPEKLVQALNSIDTKTESPWMYLDKDILQVVLEEHNLPKEISKYMPEGKISEIQDVIEQLFGLHPSEYKLIKKVSDTILHLSHLGNIVLVGRGANIITRNNINGIHIRLIDSFDNRSENIQRYFGLSKVEAAKLIDKEDSGRAAYVKKYFNKDINNSSQYSLVLNFEFLTVEDAIRLICHEVTRLRNRIKN